MLNQRTNPIANSARNPLLLLAVLKRACALLGFVGAAKGLLRSPARVGGALDRGRDARGGVIEEPFGVPRIWLPRLLQVVLLAVEQPLQIVGAKLGAIGLVLARVASRLTILHLGLAAGEVSGGGEVARVRDRQLVVELVLCVVDGDLLAVHENLFAIRDALIEVAHRLVLVKRVLMISVLLGMGFRVHEASFR
jgi:hypothetical protein